MKQSTIVILEEGSCPFLNGPDYACCSMALAPVR